MPEPPRSDATAHMAGGCRDCGAAFVVVTFPPGGVRIEVASKRIGAAICPDCGGRKIDWVLNEKHAAAVARLRREAALD